MSLFFSRRRRELMKAAENLTKKALQLKAEEVHKQEPKAEQEQEPEQKPKRGRKKKAEAEDPAND